MTSFLNACGISDSLKLIVEGPDMAQAEMRLLHQPFAIIGRDLRADVVLDHARVSRRHVYLQVIEDRVFWIDLGSRTGTRVGKYSQKLGWLEGRRTLGIGPYEIRLSSDASQNDDSGGSLLPRDAPFLVRAYSGALMPEVALEFLNGPSQSTRWPVHRVMSLLGSASGCKLRLADPSVSRFHASLVRTPMGLWVVDLLGQSGITVNSVPVRFSRLEDADVLEIGRYQIRVQCGWQGQNTGNRSPGSTSRSTLRGQNHDPSPLKFRDWAATVIGFASESGSPKGAEIQLLAQPLCPPSSVEIMPSDGAFSVKPGQPDSTESILVPLVNQFGLMQQQMFDQFQQAMSMLVHMFGKMHHDQMGVIRAELDRLHELTQEIQSLKNELAKRTQAQSQPVSRELPCAPTETDPRGYSERENLTGASPTQTPASKSQTRAVDRPSAIPAARTGFPASSPLLPKSSAPGDRLSGKVPPSVTSDPLESCRSAPPLTSEQSQSVGSRFQNNPGDLGAAADTDKDTIIWLHQRIMSIQSERESRWQKILKLLPGVS
jgi:pSer/pThr/pTyr-binding forkhead associated (FHA) protein